MKEGYQPRPVARSESKRGTSDATYGYYTMGKLMILKLRDDYKAKMGAQYSLQGFHDAFISLGPLPLPLSARRCSARPGSSFSGRALRPAAVPPEVAVGGRPSRASSSRTWSRTGRSASASFHAPGGTRRPSGFRLVAGAGERAGESQLGHRDDCGEWIRAAVIDHRSGTRGRHRRGAGLPPRFAAKKIRNECGDETGLVRSGSPEFLDGGVDGPFARQHGGLGRRQVGGVQQRVLLANVAEPAHDAPASPVRPGECECDGRPQLRLVQRSRLPPRAARARWHPACIRTALP